MQPGSRTTEGGKQQEDTERAKKDPPFRWEPCDIASGWPVPRTSKLEQLQKQGEQAKQIPVPQRDPTVMVEDGHVHETSTNTRMAELNIAPSSSHHPSRPIPDHLHPYLGRYVVGEWGFPALSTVLLGTLDLFSSNGILWGRFSFGSLRGVMRFENPEDAPTVLRGNWRGRSSSGSSYGGDDNIARLSLVWSGKVEGILDHMKGMFTTVRTGEWTLGEVDISEEWGMLDEI